MEVLIIVFAIIWGMVCAIIADNKGYNAIGAFFVGLVFGLIGVIIYACLKVVDKK